jgi:outer membrane protein OmpA-like peptidoglycan-associated protein
MSTSRGRLGSVLAFLTFAAADLSAQSVQLGDCEKAGPPSAQVMKAEAALAKGDRPMAQVYLASLRRKEPESIHVWYLDAELALLLGEARAALALYEKVFAACPDYLGDLAFRIGALHAGQGRRDEAQRYWATPNAGPEARRWLHRFQLEDSLKANPVAFNPEPIPGLDSPADEFLGVRSPDGSKWYFTRRRSVVDRKSGPAALTRLEEVLCEGIPAPSGLDVRPLERPFNAGLNEGGPSVSADDQWMVLTSCAPDASGYRNCDVFLAHRELGEWSTLRRIDEVSLPNAWDSQAALSANGDRIIFSSDRPGGRGGLDLWMSVRTDRGTWARPENLGPNINTDGDEKSPFLHADGQTLFFSSTGHPGMGGFDVFYADWTRPSVPLNLGFPINTEEDELGFGVHANEPLGYFSARREGSGFDLMRFVLPTAAAGREVAFVRGNVDGELPEDGRPTQIRIENLRTKTSQSVVVDPGAKTFTAVIAREDLAATVLELEHPDLGYTAIRLEAYREEEGVPPLTARKAEPGSEFALRSILFQTSSAVLSPEDQLALEGFARYLNRHPEFRIEIQGHTDNVGSASANLSLSQQRAQRVLEHLVQLGVDRGRLSAKGYGSSRPVASNQNEEGRSRNRRTAFEIVP